MKIVEEQNKLNISKMFEKGGEGSKGGRIIGHTKSGKPIYGTANHPAHKDFTKEDHSDAAELHEKRERVRGRDYMDYGHEKDVKAGLHHREQAKMHKELAENTLKRGSHVIHENPKTGKRHEGIVHSTDEDGKYHHIRTTTGALEHVETKHTRPASEKEKESIAKKMTERKYASGESYNKEFQEGGRKKITGMQRHEGLKDKDEFLSKIRERFGIEPTTGLGDSNSKTNITDYRHPETKEKLGQHDPEGKHTYVATTD